MLRLSPSLHGDLRTALHGDLHAAPMDTSMPASMPASMETSAPSSAPSSATDTGNRHPSPPNRQPQTMKATGDPLNALGFIREIIRESVREVIHGSVRATVHECIRECIREIIHGRHRKMASFTTKTTTQSHESHQGPPCGAGIHRFPKRGPPGTTFTALHVISA